jgi:hypothetical protein
MNDPGLTPTAFPSLWCFDGERCEVCGDLLTYATEIYVGCCDDCARLVLRDYPSDTRVADLQLEDL